MDQIYCTYMVSHPYVVPDTMFLTRKDADDHLKANRHHYTQHATSYAMTGWRSPRYEHLIQCEADECDGCMVSRLINDAFNEAGNPDMQEDD